MDKLKGKKTVLKNDGKGQVQTIDMKGKICNNRKKIIQLSE